MGGMAVKVSGNGDSLAGPGSSPDGCSHMLTSSHGFQGIGVIKHNCGGATFNSVFPSPLSRYLRKKSVMSSDVLGKFFPSWRKDDLLKGGNRFRKSKLEFCADSLALTEIIKFQFLRLWALLCTQ